jgi:formylglycine-generating enzyme required for sulfatase activity
MRPKANYLSLTGYRLPSETEWEYACRAGAVTRRFYGHSDELLAKYAWYIETSENHAWPVGLTKPNDLGLFDMHGNVWTWCHDRYEQYCDQEEDIEDPTKVGRGESRVLRGGSFNNNARNVRAAYRNNDQPDNRNNNNGFRPASTLWQAMVACLARILGPDPTAAPRSAQVQSPGRRPVSG